MRSLTAAELAQTAREIGCELADRRPDMDRRYGPAVPAPLGFTSLADLLTEPEDQVEWIVEGRITAGSINLLSGKPKAGKSTTARDLVFAVGTGGEWLGHSCVPGVAWLVRWKRSAARCGSSSRPWAPPAKSPFAYSSISLLPT